MLLNKTLILLFDYNQSVARHKNSVTSCSLNVYAPNSVPVGVQSHTTCSDRNRNWTLGIISQWKQPFQFIQINYNLTVFNVTFYT